MKFQDEYRQRDSAEILIQAIKRKTTQPWTVMEICGGQTHSIIKYGIDQMIPKEITLLHGPGCPVCVTPVEYIDKAIEISLKKNVVFCSFGDMLRVPGSHKDLFSAKSMGADVRIVYSPLDAVDLARKNRDKEVVFFAVGFETTAPANAMAVFVSEQEGLDNFSLLVSHVLVPPAMESILSSPQNRVQGFLAAGHVCTVMGYHEYLPIAEKYHVPIVVTGFEPLDILQGLMMLITQLEEGQHLVQNQYTRCVREQGNSPAQKMLQDVFEIIPRQWRGLQEIPASGFGLKQKYRAFDAEFKFGKVHAENTLSTECIIGDILTGQKKPPQCPAFGKTCVPQNPLGATMVSSEGACAAYYRYKAQDQVQS
jgi:hydrogenase expression/formation protein HypD